jgi:hypothetical protein
VIYRFIEYDKTIDHRKSSEKAMRMKARAQALLIGLAAILAAGCSGSTAVSVQPSQSEIQEGVNRRIADIDKRTDLSDEAKARMKERIAGASSQSADRK